MSNDTDVQICIHVSGLGSYEEPPDYCDDEAEPGSEYCARHEPDDFWDDVDWHDYY
jgi:hypothetical protein